MNFSYRDQWDILKSINLTEGDSKSIDCPFCGGRKKFNITKMDGKTLWNCYRASCTAKGVYSGPRSIAEAKAYMLGKKAETSVSNATPLPEMTTSIENSDKAISYVKNVNAYQAYESGFIKLRYAPGEDRVLFYTQDGLGAVGRSLKSYGSKWWTYGNTTKGVHVGEGSTAVLVEDAASACAVSRCKDMVGVALLGTNLTKDVNKSLKCYDNAVIILDNDAKQKAVSLVRTMSIPSTMRLTKVDIKELTVQDLYGVLKFS